MRLIIVPEKLSKGEKEERDFFYIIDMLPQFWTRRKSCVPVKFLTHLKTTCKRLASSHCSAPQYLFDVIIFLPLLDGGMGINIIWFQTGSILLHMFYYTREGVMTREITLCSITIRKKFVGPGTTVKAPARNIKSTEKINIGLVQITTLQPCFG